MEDIFEKTGYLQEDFRLFHLRGAQGLKSEFHYHEFYKLLLLISGTGSYTVEGRRYRLEPGDLVLVGSHCVHRPEFAPDSPYERIIVYLSPEFLRRASAPDGDLTACFSGGRGHVLRPGRQEARRLTGMLEEAERELSGTGFGRTVAGRSLLLQLLVQIGRELDRETAPLLSPSPPEDARVARILEYLQTHLAEEITVDGLAERFFLSKYHMMRLFRAQTGRTIGGYLTACRLSQARELIAGGMSATEACFCSGFGSYSAFTRACGRYFGTTPTGRNRGNVRREDPFE